MYFIPTIHISKGSVKFGKCEDFMRQFKYYDRYWRVIDKALSQILML